MRIKQCALNILLIGAGLPFAPSAFADCDLSGYDRSLPKAVSSIVNNEIVKFEWATDLDTINGRNWIWHYIKNLHADHGLGYKWPKAGLRRALGSPLEVGKTDCNRYFVTTQPALDDNAPITYGTNDAVQRAGVYSESKNAPPAGPPTGTGPGTPAEPAAAPATPTTGSIIETSYKTDAGPSENVRVLVSTSQGTTGKWLLQIERTPNVILAMATTFLNGSQVKSLIEQFRNQSMEVDADYLPKAIGREDKEVLSQFFSVNEMPDRSNQQYFILFSAGAAKASVSLSASDSRPVSTDLILFDRERRPFFATALKLLGPR